MKNYLKDRATTPVPPSAKAGTVPATWPANSTIITGGENVYSK
jgi:hypothetical protein